MFALHETTRRRVCRAAFFALCVAPTLATAVWIGEHYLPGRKGRIARQLSQQYGVHVKLSDWREPRPRLVRSSGIELSGLRSALALVQAEGVETRYSARGSICLIEQATIESAQLPQLGARVLDWLTNLPPQTQEIRIGTLRLVTSQGTDGGTNGFAVYDVRGLIERDATGRIHATLTASPAQENSGGDRPFRLTLSPSPLKDNPAMIVTLEAPVALPANLLMAVAPGFGSLGDAARFQGVIRWTLDEPAVHGNAEGELAEIELDSIFSKSSPHRVHGRAIVKVEQLSWRGPRLQRLVVNVRAEHAQATEAIIALMKDAFFCERKNEGARSANDASMIDLDLLAIRVQLDERGLTLWGACPAESGMPTGCMAVSGGQPLLVHPPYGNFDLGRMVSTLSTPTKSWLPATREAVGMADRLPLPGSAAPR
jgi:hypothetical protein